MKKMGLCFLGAFLSISSYCFAITMNISFVGGSTTKNYTIEPNTGTKVTYPPELTGGYTNAITMQFKANSVLHSLIQLSTPDKLGSCTFKINYVMGSTPSFSSRCKNTILSVLNVSQVGTNHPTFKMSR